MHLVGDTNGFNGGWIDLSRLHYIIGGKHKVAPPLIRILLGPTRFGGSNLHLFFWVESRSNGPARFCIDQTGLD